MENIPLISVIIPVFNDEKYIGKCLDSVVNQTFRNYEVIVVNDGSSDNSAEICEKYQKIYPNLKLLKQKNSGSSVARNNGIKSSSGKYLLFLDSDDFLIGNSALEKFADSLTKTSCDVLIYLPEEYDEEGSKAIISYQKGSWQENHLYHTDEILNSIYGQNGIWVTQAPTKIVSREFIIKHNFSFTAEIYHEDDEWVANVLLYSETIAFCYGPFYGRRRRRNSKSNTTEPEKAYKRTCDRIFVGSQMVSHPLAKKYKNYFEYSSEYFLNTMLRANEMDEKTKKEFIKYLSGYKKTVKKIISVKTPKQTVKALVILIFGIKKYLDFYERKPNG